MKLKMTLLRAALIICFIGYTNTNLFAQCFQIESILVDACGVQEGLNEMVRFKVGNAPINTSNLNVDWPNNPWQGLVQNAATASKVASLNADILDAGGCGQLIEPTAGILPANATVILVTSFNLDTALNSFGALTQTLYILFQNNPATASGHFANSGNGLRTLSVSFGGCSDMVTYDRALLVDTNGANVAADGAIVQFNPAGTPTYINNGCSAPVPPFTVDAGPTAINVCAGSTLSLSGIAQGQQTVAWTASNGSFSNSSLLNTNYNVPAIAGNVLLTLTATNSCGATVTDQILLTVGNSIIPNFATTLNLCTGSTAPVLNPISPNGITGIWNPATINNTASGNYTFTPNPNQCAISVTLQVSVANSIIPNFATTLNLCTGATPPVLSPISPNGITGTWNPATINNTASGIYTFTPNPNQCATSVTLQVSVANSIIPNFATTLNLCTGSTAPILNTTSPNNITGTWNPATINNTASGNYTFTPNPNQCATGVTLQVSVANSIIPNFATTLNLCTGATAPILNATSPNGITGTWNPATISNTASGNYTFTPNPNQCATGVTLQVSVANSIIPNFVTTLNLCTEATAPILNATSPNGITGTWNPATINNMASGNYTFTPNPNQCATSVTLQISVANSIIPNFATTLNLCTGATAPILNATSPNGVTGTWNPATINNTASGNYTFTPNSNQCAISVTLQVSVANSIIPNFATTLNLCTGSTAPILNAISPNGITGTWNPATISNTASGNYTFTPNPNQCATGVTLQVSVANSIIPNFATTLNLCTGSTASVLSPISQNGITGTWNPATINNTTGGKYIFTPNGGQCAAAVVLTVTVEELKFQTNSYCQNGNYIIEVIPDDHIADVVNYEWRSSGTVVGHDATLNVTELIDAATVYPISFALTLSVPNGCSTETGISVYGALCSIPKGISPNGDAKNDDFDLTGLGVKTLQIYNRYGTKVYEQNNYSNQWNGQSDHGQDLPDATYYYAIELSDGSTRTGWVYLNR